MKRPASVVFACLIRSSTSTSTSHPSAVTVVALAVCMGLAATSGAACGGHGKATTDGGNDAGTPASVTSCRAYCDMAITAQCTLPLYASVDECRMAECADLATAPAPCQTPLRIYYDCERSQPDICEDSGCVPEANDVIDCNNAAAAP